MALRLRPDIVVPRRRSFTGLGSLADLRFTGQRPDTSTRVLTGRALTAGPASALARPQVAVEEEVPGLGTIADQVLGGGLEVPGPEAPPTVPRRAPGGGVQRQPAPLPLVEPGVEPSPAQQAVGAARQGFGAARTADQAARAVQGLLDAEAPATEAAKEGVRAPGLGTISEAALGGKEAAKETATFAAPATFSGLPDLSREGLKETLSAGAGAAGGAAGSAAGAAGKEAAKEAAMGLGTVSQAIPYVGAFLGGATSGGDPTRAALISELAGMASGVPGLAIVAGLGSMLAQTAGLNKPHYTARQRELFEAAGGSTQAKEFILDLNEATTPQALYDVIARYSSRDRGGQYPIAFTSTVGGKPIGTGTGDVATVEDLLASPNTFAPNIQLGVSEGYRDRIDQGVRDLVQFNVALMQAATAGDPKAQAMLAERQAQADRYRRGLEAAGPAGLGGTLQRDVVLNALGDNAFPLTDRAGGLQRVAEGAVRAPTTAGPAFDVLNVMNVPIEPGLKDAMARLAGAARTSGDYTGPAVERAGAEFETALGAIPRMRNEGLDWERALAAQRAWEDYLRSGSA